LVKFKVKIRFRGAHVVQPTDEIRKLDHKLVLYKKIIDGRTVVSPIPPISFKGALRHMACIAARNLGDEYREAYFSLFGSDITGRCFEEEGEERKGELTPFTREGKISVELLDGPSAGNGIVEIRPRIRVDAKKGVIKKGALAFSEAMSEDVEVEFGINIREELNEKERELLRNALFLLKGWSIGGWASVGFGIVENIEIEE